MKTLFCLLVHGAIFAMVSGAGAEPPLRLLFTSQGKTGSVHSDGSGLSYFEFSEPNQATWQPGPLFPDGQRILFLSMEPRRDGPGRPFDEYYTQTPTHLWIHHLTTGSLQEIATRQRLAPFETPALLIGNDELLVQVVRNRVGQIFRIKLDGSDPTEFTRAGEGLPYGFSLSPDRKRVAFHLASPEGYQIWTSNTDGSQRVKVAAQPGHLYFGTEWSPDGDWILYVDCLPDQDPGHDWADVCVGRADGSEHKVLTKGGSMWFAATYGDPTTRGGGSNVPSWTPAGKILYPKRIPGSKVAWAYRVGEPDLDHFNRRYEPESARGGTFLCELDPKSGNEQERTPPEEGRWDFRATPSADGRLIAFCRTSTGQAPAIHVLSNQTDRMITRGLDDKGADHPRWMPVPSDK